MLAKKKSCDGEGCNGKLAYIWKNIVEDGKRLRFCQNCWNVKNSANKPTVKRQPLERSQTSIKKFSDKRSKENAAYSVLRKVFLDQHPLCQAKLQGCQLQAQDIHHVSGRSGEMLCDSSEWMSICRFCHDFLHTHDKESRKLGFIKSRLAK